MKQEKPNSSFILHPFLFPLPSLHQSNPWFLPLFSPTIMSETPEGGRRKEGGKNGSHSFFILPPQKGSSHAYSPV
jgi:hypothetical protein